MEVLQKLVMELPDLLVQCLVSIEILRTWSLTRIIIPVAENFELHQRTLTQPVRTYLNFYASHFCNWHFLIRPGLATMMSCCNLAATMKLNACYLGSNVASSFDQRLIRAVWEKCVLEAFVSTESRSSGDVFCMKRLKGRTFSIITEVLNLKSYLLYPYWFISFLILFQSKGCRLPYV